MQALEMINRVQRLLRLPESASLADQHAKLLLEMANTVQRTFMCESTVWDQCKVYSSFATQAGVSLYTISLADVGPGIEELDTILALTVSGAAEPLHTFNSDDDFRAYKRSGAPSCGMPLAFRRYRRSGDAIVVELAPIPDAHYVIDLELLQKPPRLVNATDIPLLDPDTIVTGMLLLAKHDQGEDCTLQMEAFRAKLGSSSESEGSSNWGDVAAV